MSRPVKRKRSPSSSTDIAQIKPNLSQWIDWPAPRQDLNNARHFISDIVTHSQSVLIVPDKDADGLSAGTLLHRALRHMGLPEELIKIHHLRKGNSVHSDIERQDMENAQTDKVILLDQGSRPGPAIVPPSPTGDPRVLIIDHHMSDEWPLHSLVLTACRSLPIATAALLTYLTLRDICADLCFNEGWRAVLGVFGDLGPTEAKWGTPPWPSDLGGITKQYGSKALMDAVAAINAPRRTAEYDIGKAWRILLQASHPKDIANNAFLKLCKLDVRDETERWARSPPSFSIDGRVAVVKVASKFQIHPVIATRWAGNLGRKSKKLIMVMCVNTEFHPDPNKVSFSCRIASSAKPSQPNLIALLLEFASTIEGFRERVGNDFARGHKEATGGIIASADFDDLLLSMGINVASPSRGAKVRTTTPSTSDHTPGSMKSDTRSIRDYFKPAKAYG